jgi:nickel/cobalt transporter (NiCoT) family protein
VAESTRTKIAITYALLLGANVLVWVAAFRFFAPPHALLLGTALLAYTFGLRHAVDADHICAIDNVTRKLMQEGQRPVGVGLFFSLGHSTVVVLLTVAIVLGAGSIRSHLPSLENLGGLAGTGISAAFLFVIAAINAFVLVDIVQALRRLRRNGTFAEQSLSESLDRRGLLGRFFKPLLRLVTRSRDMYFIGLLFGLGFDTATEVGLLGIAAIEAGKGLPIWAILIFPALFTAGMSFVDTTDGILMLGAYGWAFLKPERKLYYNLAITSASVLVAVVVGGVELTSIAGANVSVGWLGFAIVGAFALAWAGSMGFHALKRYGVAVIPATVEVSASNGSVPSAKSHASRWFTYALPNESASARTYES